MCPDTLAIFWYPLTATLDNVVQWHDIRFCNPLLGTCPYSWKNFIFFVLQNTSLHDRIRGMVDQEIILIKPADTGITTIERRK